jgi:hypothetical protein
MRANIYGPVQLGNGIVADDFAKMTSASTLAAIRHHVNGTNALGFKCETSDSTDRGHAVTNPHGDWVCCVIYVRDVLQ